MLWQSARSSFHSSKKTVFYVDRFINRDFYVKLPTKTNMYQQKNIAKRLDIDQYSTAKCKGQSLKKRARKNADNRVFFQKLQHLC